ncbi:hypothetical protein [Chryseobacterium sp. 18068]|uniref:hypothetical protein n=1 Tax=Chryseobacterium sp. 18068 TaxID=2681414 RepID=UPI001358EA2F|nr:hypothetical protein [Chryseobacterium sp. 18068]
MNKDNGRFSSQKKVEFNEIEFELGKFSNVKNVTKIIPKLKTDRTLKFIYPELYAVGNIKHLSSTHIDELKIIHNNLIEKQKENSYKIGSGNSAFQYLNEKEIDLSAKQSNFLISLAEKKGQKNYVSKEIEKGKINKNNFLNNLTKYGYKMEKIKLTPYKLAVKVNSITVSPLIMMNTSEIIKTLEKQDFGNGITADLTNDILDSFYKITSTADKHKALSDIYAKELSNRTDLSTKLTSTQLDERQAYHHNVYSSEQNKSGKAIISSIEIDNKKIPETLLVEYLYKFNSIAETKKDLDFYKLNKNGKGVELTTEEINKIQENINKIVNEICNMYNITTENLTNQIQSYKENNNLLIDESWALYKKIDLFENYEFVPEELSSIFNEFMDLESNEGLDYKDCEAFLQKCESLGYTFEYELDAEPFNLRPVLAEDQITLWKKINSINDNHELIGGKIKNLAAAVKNDSIYAKQFDNNTINVLNHYNSNQYFKLNIETVKTMPLQEQLASVPDLLDGNKLSDWQKKHFLSGERIDFLIPEEDYELKASFTLLNDGKISCFYPSGEEFILHTNNVSYDTDFTLEDLKISKEQRLSFSENEEFGKPIEFPLTEGQLNAIPNVLDGHILSDHDKSCLIFGDFQKENTGEFYKIENQKILKTYLNDECIPSYRNLKKNEIKFNNKDFKNGKEILTNDIDRYTELGQKSVESNDLSPLTPEEQKELKVLHTKFHSVTETNFNNNKNSNTMEINIPEKDQDSQKKWTINPTKGTEFYIKDLHNILDLKNKGAIYNFIKRNFGQELAEDLRKSDFKYPAADSDIFIKMKEKSNEIETIKPQLFFFEKEMKTEEWRDILENYNFNQLNKEGKVTIAHVDYLIQNLPKDEMINILEEFKVNENITNVFKAVFENGNIEDTFNFPLSESKLEDQFKSERYHLVNSINLNDTNKDVFLNVGQEYLEKERQNKNIQEQTK